MESQLELGLKLIASIEMEQEFPVCEKIAQRINENSK